jgi:hypothetical protein
MQSVPSYAAACYYYYYYYYHSFPTRFGRLLPYQTTNLSACFMERLEYNTAHFRNVLDWTIICL